MKKLLFVSCFLFSTSVAIFAASLDQMALFSAAAAAAPAPISDFKTNPLLSLRAYVVYDAPDPDIPGGEIGLGTQCNALLYTKDGMIILDEHCTKELKDAFALNLSVNLMIRFAKFGTFKDGKKIQPFYYEGYAITADKITFYGDYARFWVPLRTPALLQKVAQIKFPRRPEPKELKNIFSGMPLPIKEKYKNPANNPFIHYN